MSTSSSDPIGLRTSPWAIASLITGCFICCCGINGIVSIFLGVLAYRQISQNPKFFTGRGLATGGIVMGVLSILLASSFWAFMVMRYQELKPIATTLTEHFQQGECAKASTFFTDSVGQGEGFEEGCKDIHKLLLPLGEFRELSTGYSVNISGSITNVVFVGNFESGTTQISCSLLKVDGDWRFLRYNAY